KLCQLLESPLDGRFFVVDRQNHAHRSAELLAASLRVASHSRQPGDEQRIDQIRITDNPRADPKGEGENQFHRGSSGETSQGPPAKQTICREKSATPAEIPALQNMLTTQAFVFKPQATNGLPEPISFAAD